MYAWYTGDILVTGFSNFGNVTHNPSEQLMHDLDNRGLNVTTHVFKTSYKDVDANLPLLLEKYKPKIVVMFGYAGRSASVRLERIAHLPRNIAQSSTKPSFESTLPLKRIFSELSRSNIGVIYSDNAGDYLCNYLFYKVGEVAKKYSVEKFGFIHIPSQELYERAHRQPLNTLKVGLVTLEQLQIL